MAAKVLNIEICDNTVRVCRTARKGKGVRIFDSFLFPTPDDCILDGVISNTQVLAHALKKQLAAHGLHNVKNVIFSLSSSKIAVREVKLPPMKKKLLAAAIRTNAEDYFPIDLNNYHVTYTVLDTDSSAKPFSRILVMAVPISLLEGYIQLAEKTGLTVKAIDSSGNSQYQALKHINVKGVTIYVDVSCSSSIVSFMMDDKLLLQRTLAFGVDDLLYRYMKVSGKTKDQYTEILHEIDVMHPDFVANKLLSLNDVQTELNRLVTGIARSVDYFNSSQRETTASRVVLMGLNRHTLGLRELVADATGLETLYLDDIPDFAGITNNAIEAPTYISCIGSSLAPLNLIPQQFLSSRKQTVDDKDTSIVPGIVICAILVAGAIVLSLFSWLGYHLSVLELKSLDEEVHSLEYTLEIYDRYISYQRSEAAINLIETDSNSQNSKLVSFFEELEEKMPSSILLMSADCTDDGVSLNITVGSYVDAAAVISSLRTFESLSEIDIGDLSRSENEAGIERVSFTANCMYGANPYLNQFNPYGGLVYPSAATANALSESQAQ